MNNHDGEMTKCPKCSGNDISKGRLTLSAGHHLSGMAFEPEGRRFFTLTITPGTALHPESYACLQCGAVWSQTDPKALKDYISAHCKKSN